tara:strand:- start:3065 stop:3319 length:255 start_codon:yes stop_codon:yes gene_type:complete
VSEQKKEEEEEIPHPLVRVEAFFKKWSEFSVEFGVSPGPLYTAGASAVADNIRREAKDMLEVVKHLHEEIDYYEEMINEACWRC